jgi:hypothetical protein
MALKNLLGDLGLEATQLQILEEFNSEFSKILEKRFRDTEEVRYDIPVTAALPGGSIYIGVAPDPSLTTDAVWTVVRFYFDANALPSRARIRKNVVWDDRTLGWV